MSASVGKDLSAASRRQRRRMLKSYPIGVVRTFESTKFCILQSSRRLLGLWVKFIRQHKPVTQWVFSTHLGPRGYQGHVLWITYIAGAVFWRDHMGRARCPGRPAPRHNCRRGGNCKCASSPNHRFPLVPFLGVFICSLFVMLIMALSAREIYLRATSS